MYSWDKRKDVRKQGRKKIKNQENDTLRKKINGSKNRTQSKDDKRDKGLGYTVYKDRTGEASEGLSTL